MKPFDIQIRCLELELYKNKCKALSYKKWGGNGGDKCAGERKYDIDKN